MGINAWHGSTGHCFSFSAFGILFGIAAIILGKKTMSEAKSKMAYAGFWIGIAAVAVGIALWIISVIYLL